MMQIDKVMQRYYEGKLREIPDAPRPGARAIRADTRKPGSFSVSWEDVLGFIVTAAYFVQFLMPERWFALGRIASAFRVGF